MSEDLTPMEQQAVHELHNAHSIGRDWHGHGNDPDEAVRWYTGIRERILDDAVEKADEVLAESDARIEMVAKLRMEHILNELRIIMGGEIVGECADCRFVRRQVKSIWDRHYGQVRGMDDE